MLAVIVFFTILVAVIHSSLLPKHARIITRDSDLAFSYDFVIIGGGTSGLTVADRLTEDNKTSVLVIEYGHLYPNESNIHVPGLLNPTPYQFNITSTPQRGLDNATFAVPAAAVVGGGSTINGMFFDRGSAADYDVWVELGNHGWGWSDLLPYFKKSETFTPASASLAEEFTISWDDAAHGFDGPVKSSYPVFQYQSIKNFISAWHSLGVRTPQDPSSGSAKGVFTGPSSLNPSNETRSDARTAHHDAIAGSRPNYHLLTGNAVSSINFVRQKATGVEWLNRKTFEYGYVNAKKEIILAAGAAHTPQILQLSGVGPKGLLYSQDIPVVVDLPGVGQNFQDQPTLYTSYNFTSNLIPNADSLYTNTTYADEQLALYYSSRQGPYTICKNSGNVVAFNSLPDTTQGYQFIINLTISQSPEDLYLPNTDPSIIAGYEAQRKLIRNLYNSTTTSVLETGFSSATEVPLTLVRPLSRGSISISNRDPLDPPLVDWGAFTNPVDVEIMVAAVKKLRALMATTSMQELGPVELTPGTNVTSDDEIRAALKKQVQPTYSHLTSTCSMMKREYGGVVGPDLLVYGIQSLSIVDASIMPLIPATHISSTVYAVAEKAADIIKARHQL